MIENWKDIKEFEGYYQISDWGRVKSLARQKMRSNGWIQTFKERYLAQTPDKDGYLQVFLCIDSEYTTKKVHRLVAQSFLDNPYFKTDVNHNDLNKANNHVDNLEWNTHGENIRHALKMGIQIGKSRPRELNPNYKHGKYAK